jgi:hypothetical protein
MRLNGLQDNSKSHCLLRSRPGEIEWAGFACSWVTHIMRLTNKTQLKESNIAKVEALMRIAYCPFPKIVTLAMPFTRVNRRPASTGVS